MTEQTSPPKLSPQFCFSSGTLQDFLRLSRSSIDDSITQNLNVLVTPAARGFDPYSTVQRSQRSSSRPINTQACQGFKERILFPSWQTRTDVLNYCAMVATSPDPNDPEAALRQVEDSRDRERVVDERLDPYSARYFPREPRTQTLAMLVRQERSVENVVRSRTWGVVQERCGQSTQSWEGAVNAWSDEKGGKDGRSSRREPVL